MAHRTEASLFWLMGATMLATTPSFAQMQDTVQSDEGVNSSEIVVTALRRDQRLQDVPAALSVLSETSLADRGAKDFRDYLTSVPGVYAADTGYRASRVIIRGISDGLVQTSPLTGIYIDEAPVTETTQPTFDPSLYDIDRVEVLKGPQGTLYGSGSMGGTVRVILKKPNLNQFEGQVEGTAGWVSHGDMNYRLDGIVNLPIVTDKLALRLVGSYREDSGFVDDTLRGVEDTNYIKKTNLRAALRLAPTDTTTIDLQFLYQDEDRGTPPFVDHTPTSTSYTFRRAYPQTGPSETKLYSFTINQEVGSADLTWSTNYLDKFSAAHIDATSAFRGLIGFLTGISIPPTDGFGISSEGKFSVLSHELRLASASGGRFEWLVGGFYSRVKSGFTQYADLSFSPSVSAVLTGPQLFRSTIDDRSRQLAGFGELTLNLSEWLSLTAGLRAFDIDQDSVQVGQGILNGGVTTSARLSSNSSSINQKYLATFKPRAGNLLYAQAAQGFRQGGANGPLPGAVCGADLSNLGFASTPTQYNSDDLWNYEIGSKNTIAGGKATLNAAAYYTRWSKIQNSVLLPTCQFSFIGNSGEAKIKGVDLDATVNPVYGLHVGAALSYIDAEITESAPGITPDVGDRLPLVAKWSWSANVRYEFDLGDNLDAFVYGDVNHVGKRWNTYAGAGASATVLPSYTLANARIGVNFNDLSVAVFATNIFNKQYAVNAFRPTNGPYDVVGEPRVIGVNAKYAF